MYGVIKWIKSASEHRRPLVFAVTTGPVPNTAPLGAIFKKKVARGFLCIFLIKII